MYKRGLFELAKTRDMAQGSILREIILLALLLMFLVLTSLLNIVLDLLFVIVGHMGIAGVAYATILSQMVSAVLTMRLLIRTDAKGNAI